MNNGAIIEIGVLRGGTGALIKKPIPSPKDAVIAAERFGVKLSSHRSKEITPEMIDAYDIITAMETWQLNSLRKGFPNFQKNSFCFRFLIQLYPLKRPVFTDIISRIPMVEGLMSLQNASRDLRDVFWYYLKR